MNPDFPPVFKGHEHAVQADALVYQNVFDFSAQCFFDLEQATAGNEATEVRIRTLEKKLALRTENAGDRRLVNIRITDKGLRLLDEIDIQNAYTKHEFTKFSEEKARQMNEWLDELRG